MTVLTDLRNLLEAATPGEWFIVGPPWNHGAPWINAGSEDPHALAFVCDFVNFSASDEDGACESERSEQDAALIVALRNHADVLLDIAEAAKDYDERFRSPFADDGETWSSAIGTATQQAQAKLRAALARLESPDG